MVFSSYPFILAFLPAVLAAVLVLNRLRAPAGMIVAALSLASLFFYGYWNWRFLWVLLVSVCVNYGLGRLIARSRHSSRHSWQASAVLAVGIAFNLAFLGYFKYANFFLDNIRPLFGGGPSHLDIILPLGISFFTFQKIGYLVDIRQGRVGDHSFQHYLLFVTFFPQLIAGPITHHSDVIPQFVSGQAGQIRLDTFTLGLAMFVLGVAKKVLIADQVAGYANPVFNAAAAGVPMPFLEAWCGTLAYTFQIYFDFSGYSDMAIGLGLMLNVRLPINFNSPYKATSLIDFWRRWHITLSRFLRDYLYVPLGGNRLGERRRYINLLIVMLLGGLWHGAAWTFVVWGAMHGAGLAINHLWRTMRPGSSEPGLLGTWTGRIATFVFVAIAWVMFRATDMATAINVLKGMIGANGLVLPDTYFNLLGGLGPKLAGLGVRFEAGYLFLGIKQIGVLATLFAVVTLAPNTLQIARYLASPDGKQQAASWWMWRPNVGWGLGLSALAIAALVMMSDAGEFLYFQF